MKKFYMVWAFPYKKAAIPTLCATPDTKKEAKRIKKETLNSGYSKVVIEKISFKQKKPK